MQFHPVPQPGRPAATRRESHVRFVCQHRARRRHRRRDIVVGARATAKFLDKAAVVVKNDAPTIEAFTSLVDPRAATIERIGAALIGQIEPQISKVSTEAGNTAAAPTVALTSELIDDLKALYASMAPELATAKAAVKPS